MMHLHTPRPGWQQQMADTIDDARTLCQLLDLDPAALPVPLLQDSAFPLRVPRVWTQRMQRGNPRDPLLLQVLASTAETALIPGFSSDPVGDLAAATQPGLLHKYHGRVLIVTTGACALHCRYCFRRHFPYPQAASRAQDLMATLRQIELDPSINEVILSGGDPLSLADSRLGSLIRGVEAIPHVTTLRLHTRIPTVIPDRITQAFCNLFKASRLNRVMVLHVNHPQELSELDAAPLQRLRQAGFTLLNQSVLLRSVNDEAATLAQLSYALFQRGVLPYYLHALDKVSGAAHFQVAPARAATLYRQLSALLPGYLLPRFVEEIPGQPHKSPFPI